MSRIGNDAGNESAAVELADLRAELDSSRHTLEEQAERFEKLLEITRTLASTLELPRLLNKIISAATHLIGTQSASILLVDPKDGELRFEVSTEMGPGMAGIIVPREGSIAGWIAMHGEPLIVEDVSSDPRFYQRVDNVIRFSTRSILGVPMVHKNRVIGVLEAVNKLDGRPFQLSDQDTLMALAAQAAVAVENARLFQQSDLITELVHELRTPMAALLAQTHILLAGPLPDEKVRERVRTIQREVARLKLMTTEFLDLARLESGRARMAKQPVNLRPLIEETVEAQSGDAAARSIRIICQIPEDLPTITGDHDRLRQVMHNLLSNAIKYNLVGGEIDIRTLVGPQFIEVTVQDTGRGIHPKSLPHVFDKFYREADAEHFSEGTGLGLPIVRQIVEGHGGEVAVDSLPGSGTTVRFTLPRSHPEDR